MYKLIFLIFVLLITSNFSIAQVSELKNDYRNEFAKNEMARLQQLLQCEQQKTDNQDDYDVTYYSLNLTPDPLNSTLTGIVEIEGAVIAQTLDHIELNFWDGMNITDLYLTGSPGVHLSYNRSNDILSIYLNRVYVQGEIFGVTVEYNGRPQDSEELGWGFGFDTYDGEPMIWSFSQPWGARVWWPCKDVPSDKADSVDIRVTVPNNLIVASNGSLIETTTNGNNTTYWWHEKYPIATYLVSLAIYPYEVHYDDYVYNNGNDIMKIHFYTFPGNYEVYNEINMKVKDMLEYFSEIFGQYPFIEEKYGHADFTEGGAMEHQTITSFHFWNEWAYSHELAHQWWGDMVTYDSWHHTWLSEGLAVYSEALWHEHINGPGTANDYQMNNNLYFGRGTIYVEDPENFIDIIDNPFYPGLVFDKGSWIFHMLRHIVGDENFFNILIAHGTNPAHNYGTATTESFQAVCEQVTGMDLDQFFHQWIYEEYFPTYSYTWNWNQNGSNYDVNLEIKQEQDNYIFHMPIDITITTADSETTFVVENTLQTQSFQFSISSEPVSLELDKYNWILKLIQEPFIDPTFDQGILLVNGVSFDTYGQEIRTPYENYAFWGDYPISFWDCFDTPIGGYPSTLPDPLGHGKIPNETLGKFSSIIWIGNNYRGDLSIWQRTQILSYLQAGGNLILLTRTGKDFLGTNLKEYLDISWEEYAYSTIQNCIAVYPGLSSIAIIGPQTSNAVFNSELTNPESSLLFEETVSFGVPRGIGVWHKPSGGGIYNIDGGQFVFISGRPYRYNHNQLKANIEFILENFFNETGTDVKNTILIPDVYYLKQNYPNPFNPATTITFSIHKKSPVSLKIFNTLGEQVSYLVNEEKPAGFYELEWDATGLPSGVYFYRLQAGSFVETKKMVLMK